MARVTLLARGSRPPLGAEAAAADVVAGGVVEAEAGVAAVLAVLVLLARCRGAEQAGMVGTGWELQQPGSCQPSQGLGEDLSVVVGCSVRGFCGVTGK